MLRYCILSIPRSGSTWLLTGINHVTYPFKNSINLHEFFTPFTRPFVRYELDDINNIIEVVEKTRIDVINLSDFIDSRMDIFLKGDSKQPLVFKYMYWSRNEFNITDIDNLKKIQNHNVTIINLNRNVFDSTISALSSGMTGNNHRWNTPKDGEWWSTVNGRSITIDISKIIIPEVDFEATYMQFIMAYREKQKLSDELGCKTINYESLRTDCIKNKIPFQILSHSKKLYDIGYNQIIENYDKLLEIKEKINVEMGHVE
jgi:hypothetical protein